MLNLPQLRELQDEIDIDLVFKVVEELRGESQPALGPNRYLQDGRVLQAAVDGHLRACELER